MQRNWIGRSEGAEIDFHLEGSGKPIRVFTTRVDTIYRRDVRDSRARASAGGATRVRAEAEARK